MTRSAPVLAPALVLGLLLFDAPLAAQQGDAGAKPGGETAEDAATEPAATFSATATVRERPLSSATAAVDLIGREDIEASGALSVAEVLRFAPGVNVTTNGRGGLTTAEMRGGDPNFTLVLLDGVPLNDPTYPVGDVFNLEGLSAQAVERIEVVRGPLSSFYGSTGLAGVINVVTRRGEAGAPALDLAAGAGDASLRTGRAALSGGHGDGATWLVAGGWDEEHGRIAEESFERGDVHANLSTAVGGLARLELSTRWASWQGEDYPDASGGPVYGSGELRRSDHDEASLGASLLFGPVGEPEGADRGRHRLSLALYRHGLERESPAIEAAVPASVEDTTYTRARLGWVSTLVERDGLHLAAGADVERERGENESLLLLPPEFGGAVPGDYAITRTLPGAYAELTAGRGNAVVEVGSRLDAPEGRALQWSPRLGVSWRPRGGATRLHASAGRAWKQPSFFALASPRALGGNPDLLPETVLGGDIGAERAFGAPGKSTGLRAGITLFYNRYAELIDFDFASFQHVNRSRVEAKGAEASLGWTPASWLAVHGALAWQEVADQATGDPLRHRPRWLGSLRLLGHPRERLSLQLAAEGAADSLDEQIPVPERTTVPGYLVLGLAGAWDLGKSWQVSGRVDNLADREYETLIGFPGAGRSFRLGLRYRERLGRDPG